MKKIITALFLFGFLILFFSAPAWSINLKKMTHDYLGKGYAAASENRRIISKKYFRKAFDLASKSKDWTAMIDAARSLLVLGEEEEASKDFDKTGKLLRKLKDWRGSVALAYSYLSYPKNLINKTKVLSCLDDAKKYAASNNDWHGLVEIAEAYEKIPDKNKMAECIGLAELEASNSKSVKGLISVALFYKKIGKFDESQRLLSLSDKYKSEFKNAGIDWENFKPYGKTIAEPKVIDTATQAAERQSADAEISATYNELQRLAEKEASSNEYYIMYDDYYDYPYYYRYYSNYSSVNYLPPDWLCDWANYNLARYSFADGVYIFNGW